MATMFISLRLQVCAFQDWKSPRLSPPPLPEFSNLQACLILRGERQCILEKLPLKSGYCLSYDSCPTLRHNQICKYAGPAAFGSVIPSLVTRSSPWVSSSALNRLYLDFQTNAYQRWHGNMSDLPGYTIHPLTIRTSISVQIAYDELVMQQIDSSACLSWGRSAHMWRVFIAVTGHKFNVFITIAGEYHRYN